MIKKVELDFFLEYAGKSYDKNNIQHQEARKRIFAEIFYKKNFAMELAAKKLFPSSEPKNPDISGLTQVHNPQLKQFRSELYKKFSPKNKFSRLVDYWFNLKGNRFIIGLGIKGDSTSENLKNKENALKAEFKIENSKDFNTDISENELADWIVNSIEKFDLTYDEFCEKLQPDLDDSLSKLTERQEKKKNNHDQNIWKMLHGKEKDISEAAHEWLIDNGYIAIGYKPGDGQRKKFEEMRAGDFFYLVRNSKVVLLGQIENQEITNTPEHLNQPNWVMRKFIKIKDPVRDLYSTQVKGEKKGWKPVHNSTINEVGKNDLVEFEETILQPAFGLNLTDLQDSRTISPINKQTDKKGRNSIQIPRNQILYGPPGTGKTFNTINLALSIADPEFEKLSKSRDEVKKRFDQLIEEGQIVFTTFHQSMSYEDFIEGIKPETNENGVVTYEVKSGIFKEICNSASTPNKQGFEAAYKKLQEKLRDEISEFTEDKTLQLSTPRGKEFSVSLNSKGNLRLYTGKDKKNPQGVLTKENLQKQINGEDIWYGGYCKGVLGYLKENFGYSAENIDFDKNYVLIIDEINRGNVSQIFGELITLIEDGKRLGQEEALSVKLPYSKESERDFGVPSNVYIIGTMNTADRSVEALDAALRRRFSFIEMPPKPALIKTEGKLKDTDGILHIGELGKIDLANLLDVINKRIEKLLDSDHQIGHSFFLKVYDIESLKNEFQNKIIPLLKEYFYGDFGKLGLVLGKGFFENIETSDNSIFANFGSFDNNDFNERVIYKLKTISSNNGISGMRNEDFLDAINQLLNIKLP